jgi:glycosyltransferase involved in cell wall biosynthesis
MSLPISVCLISGAEERRIGRTLESVAGWTREIIVVLNEEVRDGTEEIALRHGARVVREPWKGFRDQKNSVAQKATQEWILGLDTDEVVSPELRAEIERTFSDPRQLEQFAAFSFPRLTHYCGRWIRHGDWYPDRSTRLWRKGRADWGGADVHEKLHVNGLVGKLQADLFHFTNESINRHLQKLVPFSDEFVKKNLAADRSASVFDLAVRPPWRFIRAYIFRLGFLDGWQGYYIACHNAFSAVARYAKLRDAREQSKPETR